MNKKQRLEYKDFLKERIAYFNDLLEQGFYSKGKEIKILRGMLNYQKCLIKFIEIENV